MHRPFALASLALTAGLLVSHAPAASAAAAPPQPQTSRVSVSTTGVQAIGGHSQNPDISTDGRWVVFQSAAGGLLPGFGVAPTHTHIYRADRLTGAVVLVSVPNDGPEAADGDSEKP